jgi:hypothetical protein
MVWWIIGGAGAIVFLLPVWVLVGRRRKPTIQQTVQVPVPVDQNAPSTGLEFLHRLMTNKDYTDSAAALMTSGSKALSRILLCLGFVLALIIGIVVGLAWLLAPVIGSGAAIGGGVVVGGGGLFWVGRLLWKRFSPKQQSRSATSRNRRINP